MTISASKITTPQPQRKLSSAAAVAQSVGAKLLILMVNAATGILTARTLAPEGRGILATLILWPIFLASALTLGLPSSLTYQLRSREEEHSSLMASGLLISLVTSLLAIVVGVLFLPYWIPQYGAETIFWARIFVISAPLQSLGLAGRAALESRGNFVASNKMLVASPLLTLVCLVVLRLTHTMTPLRAAFSYVVVGVVPTFWMLALLWKAFHPRFVHVFVSCRMLLSYGIRSYGIDLCGTMALYVDQALVVRLLSPESFGIYVVALSLSRMLNAFHLSVVMVLFPRAVAQEPDAVREMTSRSTRLSTLLTAAAGTCIIILGPQALTLLYGAQYRSATQVLRVLVLEVILAGATTVLSQAFMALGRPGVITFLQIVGLLLTVPMLLLLAPKYGLLGAGIALLLSTTTRFLLVMVGFPIFLKLPMPRVVATAEDIRYLIALFSRILRREAHA
ncbi:lipopolysaccharide biosynthesis protein [Terriglobus tenax]|uniref:lipopolysaccharide biosynthesis protein n=1 Tax=Terriglobus tenax TaxID=1111115 RepID=UPI0021DF90DC|nr:oligosaccharide flippase family protein [Terriglobus tenax]